MLVALICLVVVNGLLAAGVAAADGDDMNPFKPTWQRTDQPVAD